jgi:hypothetical protein
MKNAPLDQSDAKKLEELEQKLEEIKANATQSLAKIPGDPNRKAAMTEASMETLKVPGIKDIKQVEMTKFKKFVPEAFKLNPICKTPDSSITQKIKGEKNAKVRERNNKRKAKKAKMEDTTKDEGGCKDEGFI